MTIDFGANDLFVGSVAENIKVPTFEPAKTYGIMDIDPEQLFDPPEFTEPETIEAMKNLRIRAEDLIRTVVAESGIETSAIQEQIMKEREKRRLVTIERVVTERGRILNRGNGIDDGRTNEKTAKVKNKKPRTKKRANAEEHKTEAPPKMSKLPRLFQRKKKESKNDEEPRKTNRRVRRKSNINLRLERVLKSKAEIEQDKINSAIMALKKVDEIERMNQEMKKKKLSMIKEKARLRLEKIKRIDNKTKESLVRKKEIAKTELIKQEKFISKIKNREMKKYEVEHKKRMLKIYGVQPSKSETKNSISELRRKIMESKLRDSSHPKEKSHSDPGKSPEPPSHIIETPIVILTPQQKMHTKNAISRIRPIIPEKNSRIPYFRPRK